MSRPFFAKSLLPISLLCMAVVSNIANAAPSAPPAAAICSCCHGGTGLGLAHIAPMIAGLNEGYFIEQITHFKRGKRTNPTMPTMPMTIPDEKTTKLLAHYYSQLPVPNIKKTEQRGDAEIIKDPARTLTYQGDWNRNIPACSTCHAPSGVGIDHFPRLTGQHADYIKSQLLAWQNGSRTPDAGSVMATIASKLTATEIDQLAHYFSTVK